MNNNESPLSIAEQIEVLEAAKENLVSLSDSYACIGLCHAIDCAIYKRHKSLSILTGYSSGIHKVIPSFTFENAVLYGTDYEKAAPNWYWWSTEVAKGGITNRLAFLDYLINKLKNEYHE